MLLLVHVFGCIGMFELRNRLVDYTVQFNYNFTHAWYSMHGVPQVFTCKIQKIAVCIIISIRRDVSLLETTCGICLKRVITRDVAVKVPISWGSTRIMLVCKSRLVVDHRYVLSGAALSIYM